MIIKLINLKIEHVNLRKPSFTHATFSAVVEKSAQDTYIECIVGVVICC